jgi:hypothetical protein
VPKVGKITWYFKEQELVPDVDYKTVSDGILLERVGIERAGKYSCVALQELDEFRDMQKREMELIVECK